MAFKMKGSPMYRNFGIGTPMKTGHPSQKTPQGEDLIAGDKNFTKKEQRKDARLEDKNNDAAARREYMEMMKAKKASPLQDSGHGLGNHGKHGTKAEYNNAVARWNKGDPLSQRPNAKKLAKKTEKAEKKKATYKTKMDAHTKLVTDHFNSGKEFKDLPGKERRALTKSGNKAVRAHKKSNVAESVRKYQAGKVGNYMDRADTKVMKTGKGLKVTLPGRTNVDRKNIKYGVKPGKGQTWGGNAGKRKFGKKKGSIEVVDKERVDIDATHKQRKKYRQNKGLRGAVNARRTGKGKDKI